jgi:hypothetical protein
MQQILHWGLETTKYGRSFVGSEFLFDMVPEMYQNTAINRQSFRSAPYALQEYEVKLTALDFGEEV